MLNHLGFQMFLFLSGHSVLSTNICDIGQYLSTGPDGQEICQPCQHGSFMPKDRHDMTECQPCTGITNPTIEVFVSQCNRTHDTFIQCIDGYFRTTDHKCKPCTKCPHPKQLCQKYSDTICCPDDGYKVYNVTCVKVCRRGQYFIPGTDECVPCPPNEFMDEESHHLANCKKCDSSLKDHAMIVQNCNGTHPTLISCLDGYYKHLTTSDQSLYTCQPCQDCSVGQGYVYVGRMCTSTSDTVCCPLPNMNVFDTPNGPECQPSNHTVFCGKGQYLYFNVRRRSYTCQPCPAGTYLNEPHHSRGECQRCDTYGEEVSECSSPSSLADTERDIAILVPVVLLIILLICCLLFCYRRRLPKKYCPCCHQDVNIFGRKCVKQADLDIIKLESLKPSSKQVEEQADLEVSPLLELPDPSTSEEERNKKFIAGNIEEDVTDKVVQAESHVGSVQTPEEVPSERDSRQILDSGQTGDHDNIENISPRLKVLLKVTKRNVFRRTVKQSRGWVECVNIKTQMFPCPCHKSQEKVPNSQGTTAVQEWGEIFVRTKSTLINNEKNAQLTTCTFSEEPGSPEMIIPSSKETKVWDLQQNNCMLTFVTHDMNLLKRLSMATQKLTQIQEQGKPPDLQHGGTSVREILSNQVTRSLGESAGTGVERNQVDTPEQSSHLRLALNEQDKGDKSADGVQAPGEVPSDIADTFAEVTRKLTVLLERTDTKEKRQNTDKIEGLVESAAVTTGACPCHQCQKSAPVAEQWGEICVSTQTGKKKHARHIKCTFSDQLDIQQQGVSLSGQDILRVQAYKRKLMLLYVTHNLDLVKTLLEATEIYQKLRDAGEERTGQSVTDKKALEIFQSHAKRRKENKNRALNLDIQSR